MDDPDAFFTLTIVGAPTSLLLGRRLTPAERRAQGLDLDLATGGARLTEAWRDLALLQRGFDADGEPFRRPRRARRWLERHALLIGAAGAAGLAGSALLAGALLWR
ncbi:MAG: hypothetical protein HYZ20_02050 [Burkholderiales bacterium]|nr:hypothetical protein [Burkholderiales bacterium]